MMSKTTNQITANISTVVSTHRVTAHSGVAKFSEKLANEVGAFFFGFNTRFDLAHTQGIVLYSTKIADLGEIGLVEFEQCFRRCSPSGAPYGIFLHSYTGSIFEREFVCGALFVIAGNREIFQKVAALKRQGLLSQAWCPSLLEAPDQNKIDVKHRPASRVSDFAILSFGMGYKFNTAIYIEAVEKICRFLNDPVINLSSSVHEIHGVGSFEKNLQALKNSYPNLNYLGNLTDAQLFDVSHNMDAFLCLYDGGAKDNNTTLYAAAELGLPILTNIGAFSPEWLNHRITCIDVNDDLKDVFSRDSLEKISSTCRAFIETNRNWDLLVKMVRDTATTAMTPKCSQT